MQLSLCPVGGCFVCLLFWGSVDQPAEAFRVDRIVGKGTALHRDFSSYSGGWKLAPKLSLVEGRKHERLAKAAVEEVRHQEEEDDYPEEEEDDEDKEHKKDRKKETRHHHKHHHHHRHKHHKHYKKGRK